MKRATAILALLIAGCLSSAYGDAAEPTDVLTLEAILATPTPALAERFLTSAEAADVERFETEWNPGATPHMLEVRLYHLPAPVADDICLQVVDLVGLRESDPNSPEPRDRHPLDFRYTTRIEQIVLAPGCRVAPDQGFVILQSDVERGAAIDLLRSLAAARAAAAGTRRLPFRLSCRDVERRGACRGGERATLARLPIERARLIGEDLMDDRSGLAIVIAPPDDPWWYVQVRDYGTARARISMISQEPPPF